MQIPSSSPPAPQPPSAPTTGVVAEVRRLADLFAEGSSASNEEKLAAYSQYQKLRFEKPWEDASSYSRQSSQADRDAINDIVAKSSFVTDLNDAASRFSSKLNAGARTGGPDAWLKAFNGLSDWDQQKVRIGMGWDQKSASVEDLKAQLGAAGERQAALDATETASPKDSVDLTADARAALLRLKADRADTIAASILETLEKADLARKDARDDRRSPDRAEPYAPGDTFAFRI